MARLEPLFDSRETVFKSLHTKFATSFRPCLPLHLSITPSNDHQTKIMRLLNRLRRPDRLTENRQLPLKLVRMYPKACLPFDLLLVNGRHLAQRSLCRRNVSRVGHGSHAHPLGSLNGGLIQQSKPVLSL